MYKAIQYLIAGWWALASVACQNPAQKKVFGRVDGRPISDRVFADTRINATDLFRFTHNREPATPADEQEIEASVEKTLCGRLKTAITLIVRQEETEALRVLFKTTLNDPLDCGVEIFDQLRRAAMVLGRPLTGDHLVKHQPDRIEVASRGDFLARLLLRRHVGGRATADIAHRDLLRHRRQTEIGDPDLPPTVDHDVGRL